MKKFTIRFSMTGLLLLALLTACSPASSPGVTDIIWKLDSYADTLGNELNALPDAEATLEFGADQLNGTTGCNNYFANYTLDGKKLTLGPAGSTKMACEESRMAQENAFLAAFAKVASYRMDVGKLDLLDAEGEVLLSFSELEPLPLVGTNWVMNTVNNGQGGVVSRLEGVDVNAVFEKSGTVGGNAGCNSYSAEYKAEGDKITVTQALSTLMACENPSGVMQQEAAFLQAFSRAAIFKIRGDTLNIYDASGALLISFDAAS